MISTEMILNALSAILFALGAAVLHSVWAEIKTLRRRTHRLAQFSVRHEGGIEEMRTQLGLPPMPPIQEDA